MLRPSFRAVELSMGCLKGGWKLPRGSRPVVIAGPAGSGKTTLVQGVVGTVFGLDRRGREGQVAVELRTPWRGDGAWGRVLVSRGIEWFEIRRDFETGQVTVRSPADDIVHFEGIGDPAAGGRDGRRYRQILSDLLGLRDLDTYARTIYVHEGGLVSTSLDDQLLSVAAGGHARVEAARREIAEAHRGVTARPLHATAQPAINPRDLERVEEEIAMLRARLDAAREAGARRAPLALDRERTAERLARLSAEIETLEDAHGVLAQTGAIEATSQRLRDLDRDQATARSAVLEAKEALDAARLRVEETSSGGLYPADFPERLARAELRWRDLDEIDRRRNWWLAVATAATATLALALALAGQPVAWVVAPAGLATLGGAVWLTLNLDARRRRQTVRTDLVGGLEGVPDADALGPGTRERAVERYLAQRAAAAELAAARSRLADALREARRSLAKARSMGVRPVDPPPGQTGDRVAMTVAWLEAMASGVEDALTRERADLDRVGDASLNLPDGVVPTAAGVLEALRGLRWERQRAEESLQSLGQEMLERGAPAESLDALEAALASLEPRRERLERKARILEAAYALVTDAHDAFQAGDQERLLREISARLRELTDGRLDGIEVGERLEDARVRMDGRLLPMSTPPLSFGEQHALLLAIRLGAAAFLTGVGISPPLIIEEPFAHLDPERSAAVWATLERVAEDRQVIVTTQDTLLLEHLGVEADILLGAPPHVGPRPDVSGRPAGPPASRRGAGPRPARARASAPSPRPGSPR